MKRLILLLMIILLSGCNNASVEGYPRSETELLFLDDLTVIVDESTLSQAGLDLILVNETEYDFRYGPEYELEFLENGKWYKQPDGPVSFSTGVFRLNKGDRKIWSIDWSNTYGLLEPGKYRIIKYLISDRSIKGETPDNYVPAEFEM